MEVEDGDPISAGLLEQMGSLQTLDHDDLVSQMMRLVGPSNLTPENAKFYLDMNGWNVQAAVCAYFDLNCNEADKQLPKMTFCKDATVGEGEAVQPGAAFIKTWKVQNSGLEAWPEGCQLRFTQGTLMTLDGLDKVEVRALLPAQLLDVQLEMKAPEEPGIYESKWRMSTNTGAFFGDTIWVIIQVEPAGTLALTQQMNNFTFPTQQQRLQQQQQQQQHHHNPFSPKKNDESEEQMN